MVDLAQVEVVGGESMGKRANERTYIEVESEEESERESLERNSSLAFDCMSLRCKANGETSISLLSTLMFEVEQYEVYDSCPFLIFLIFLITGALRQ